MKTLHLIALLASGFLLTSCFGTICCPGPYRPPVYEQVPPSPDHGNYATPPKGR